MRFSLSEAGTLMAVTIEDLYRNYGLLADAKDDLSQVGEGHRRRVHRFGSRSCVSPRLTATGGSFVDLRS